MGGNLTYVVDSGIGSSSGTLNQASGGNAWFEIGQFDMASSGSPYVEFRDDQGQRIVVDAVRIECLPSNVAVSTTNLPSGQIGSA